MTKELDTTTQTLQDLQMGLQTIQELLQRDGFRSEIDEDGDLSFKWEGRRYFIRIDDDDPSFVRLCAVNIAPSLQDEALAIKLSNQVNLELKVAKAFCVESKGRVIVWVTAECRYATAGQFVSQLERLLGGVRAGVNHFRESIPSDAGLTSDSEVPDRGLLN